MSGRAFRNDPEPQRGFLHHVDAVLLDLAVLYINHVAFVQEKLGAANQLWILFDDRSGSCAACLFVRNSQ